MKRRQRTMSCHANRESINGLDRSWGSILGRGLHVRCAAEFLRSGGCPAWCLGLPCPKHRCGWVHSLCGRTRQIYCSSFVQGSLRGGVQPRASWFRVHHPWPQGLVQQFVTGIGLKKAFIQCLLPIDPVLLRQGGGVPWSLQSSDPWTLLGPFIWHLQKSVPFHGTQVCQDTAWSCMRHWLSR